MTLAQLRQAVAEDTIDTVVLAIPDMQGRLQGKRLDARHFLEDVLTAGTEGCAYLLTVDVDMQVLNGFEISGWASGLGDFHFVPDLETLRLVPWMPGTAMMLADAQWSDGTAVSQSPRDILRRQIARLEHRGWRAQVATELEFLLFDNSYRDAHAKRYHDLEPASVFNIDYSIFGTSRVEPVMRKLRRGMSGAGLQVEAIKGECNPGQFELGFRYAEAMRTCDNHVIYKNGAKEIAAQDDVSVTFMAKFNEREGNSCHVHLSLVDSEGRSVFAADDGHGFSKNFQHFIAGQLATAREFALLVAPNVNSYKRYQDGSFAPTALRWGRDNRTCAIRVVGHGPSLRLENRAPGGDVNPYLAVAAIVAGGLHGLENELELEPEAVGNAYEQGGNRLPTSLREAITLFRSSTSAAKAFGEGVVRHYANAAEQEAIAFESAITDWERLRGFERL